jgi:hypothetical protein
LANTGQPIDHTALDHHLLQLAQARWVRRVPAHARQHHLDRTVQTLEHLAQRVVHLLRGIEHRIGLAVPRYCNRTMNLSLPALEYFR